MFNFSKFQILISKVEGIFHNISALSAILLLIGSAVLIVVCFRKLNLSPVLGYLCAGILVGEHGLEIIPSSQTSFIAEFGVVFLLFAIGLELSFARLKDMRQYVLGLGSLQIIGTFSIFYCALSFIFELDYRIVIIVAGGISLSSTAVVLQVIEDMRKQSTQFGRISLAVLLQQDFFVIPLIVLVPILASNAGSQEIVYSIFIAIIKAFIALVGIFITGRIFLRPLYRIICSASPGNTNELLIPTTLFIVLSAAWTTQYFGLSLELGAFAAGILVAETEFRSQAEKSISPFKDILLGLFFMSVGMTINVKYIYEKIHLVAFYTSCVVIVKFVITFGSCYMFRLSRGLSLQIALLLAQGSEFSFVLCKLAIGYKLLDSAIGEMMLVVVTISMALTPLLSLFGNYLSKRFDSYDLSSIEKIRTNTEDLTNHVIIVGLSSASEMASAMLTLNNINHIIIDYNEQSVKKGIEMGVPIFLGDGTDIDTLKAAGIKRSKGVMITYGTKNPAILREIINRMSSNFAQIPVVVCTHNLKYAKKLLEVGANTVVSSSHEAGLELASVFLRDHGFSSQEISRIKNIYRSGEYSKISSKDVTNSE